LAATRIVALSALVAAVLGHASSTRSPATDDHGCPYDFLSEMSAGEFCVYRGEASAASGRICDDDAVVIWSTHASDSPLDDTPPRDVYVGFVDAPSLLLHALAVHPTRSRVVDLRAASGEEPTPLDGLMTLGGSADGQTLTLQLRAPLRATGGWRACGPERYRGVFVGVLGLPDVDWAGRVHDQRGTAHAHVDHSL